MTELKKAFEQMKKELKSVDPAFAYGFTMSKRQEELGVATFMVGTLLPFEKEIEMAEADISKVNSYETWTDEEKQKYKEGKEAVIENLKMRMAKYCTKDREYHAIRRMIEYSAAFKKFQGVAGKVELRSEIKENFYQYIRFYF